jgi:hypothetical protein
LEVPEFSSEANNNHWVQENLRAFPTMVDLRSPQIANVRKQLFFGERLGLPVDGVDGGTFLHDRSGNREKYSRSK